MSIALLSTFLRASLPCTTNCIYSHWPSCHAFDTPSLCSVLVLYFLRRLFNRSELKLMVTLALNIDMRIFVLSSSLTASKDRRKVVQHDVTNPMTLPVHTRIGAHYRRTGGPCWGWVHGGYIRALNGFFRLGVSLWFRCFGFRLCYSCTCLAVVDICMHLGGFKRGHDHGQCMDMHTWKPNCV